MIEGLFKTAQTWLPEATKEFLLGVVLHRYPEDRVPFPLYNSRDFWRGYFESTAVLYMDVTFRPHLDIRDAAARLGEFGTFLASTAHAEGQELSEEDSLRLRLPGKARWQLTGPLVRRIVELLYEGTDSRYAPMLPDRRQVVFDILHWEKKGATQ